MSAPPPAPRGRARAYRRADLKWTRVDGTSGVRGVTLYDTAGGVERYIEMAKGYDGRELVATLRELVPAGATG